MFIVSESENKLNNLQGIVLHCNIIKHFYSS